MSTALAGGAHVVGAPDIVGQVESDALLQVGLLLQHGEYLRIPRAHHGSVQAPVSRRRGDSFVVKFLCALQILSLQQKGQGHVQRDRATLPRNELAVQKEGGEGRGRGGSKCFGRKPVLCFSSAGTLLSSNMWYYYFPGTTFICLSPDQKGLKDSC